MTVLLLLMGHALASGLPQWPIAEDTVPGECASSVGISKGSSALALVDDSALARCSFVAEPLSSYAHLLAIEAHAKQVRALYELDTATLIEQRDHWSAAAKRSTAWYRQQWFVAVTSSLLVTGIGVTYSMSKENR